MLAFTGEHVESKGWIIDVSPDDLADALVIELRNHSHFSNVLTHVSDANWPGLEAAFGSLLDPTSNMEITPLQKNLLALLCGGSGTTGRMLKPWFDDWLRWACGAEAKSLIEHLSRLHGVAAEAPRRRKKSAMRILREHDERCVAAAFSVAEGV